MRRMSWLLVALLALSPGLAAAEGGFAGFFRALTGALGGRSDPTASKSTVTATIGVRGMDDGELANAAPSEADLKLLDGWAANRLEATAAAKRRGVSARNATMIGG